MGVDNKKIKQVQWCATEKIHGANFCWIISEDGVQGGNRNQILEPNAPFFNWQSVLARVKDSMEALYAILRDEKRAKVLFEENFPVVRAFVFGEIFGGTYPDLASPAGVKAVQTGIYYSPNIEFAAFDLAVTFESSPSVRSYVNFEDAMKLFTEVGIFHVEPLMVGTYTQAVNFNNRFESGISRALGYPPVTANLAEGIVIRPMRTILVPTKKGIERPILKSKIPEFSEDRRFQAATKWEQPADSSTSGAPSWQSSDTIIADLSYEMSSLVTTQRIDNAISKLGHVDPTDKPRMRILLDHYIKDIMDQVQENFAEQWNSVEQNARAELEKGLRKEAVALFRSHFNLASQPSS